MRYNREKSHSKKIELINFDVPLVDTANDYLYKKYKCRYQICNRRTLEPVEVYRASRLDAPFRYYVSKLYQWLNNPEDPAVDTGYGNEVMMYCLLSRLLGEDHVLPLPMEYDFVNESGLPSADIAVGTLHGEVFVPSLLIDVSVNTYSTKNRYHPLLEVPVRDLQTSRFFKDFRYAGDAITEYGLSENPDVTLDCYAQKYGGDIMFEVIPPDLWPSL